MDVAQPLRRKLRRAGASPGHHASDIFTVFPEEHVGKTGHTGVFDVPPYHLLVKAHCLVHVIGDKFVPDEAVCHFAPSICHKSLRSKHRPHTLSPKSGCCLQSSSARYTLPEQTMKKNVSIEKRKTFRHGDLRNALVTAGLEMARVGGPNAVILREATRQAGVSPNAAYRHFAGQAELLDAVRSACLSRVAAAIEEEMKKCHPGRNPQAFARKSLRAVGMGYLGFAMREPGMFRTAFSVPPAVHEQNPANTASMGLNPFQLLSLALDRMQESGLLGKKVRQDAEYLAWSTVHGLALLVLEGPLHQMPQAMVLALGERLVLMVERGLN